MSRVKHDACCRVGKMQRRSQQRKTRAATKPSGSASSMKKRATHKRKHKRGRKRAAQVSKRSQSPEIGIAAESASSNWRPHRPATSSVRRVHGGDRRPARPATSSVPRVNGGGSNKSAKVPRYIAQAIQEIGPSSGDYSSTFSNNGGSRYYWGGGMSW